jgi:hypothetical protein
MVENRFENFEVCAKQSISIAPVFAYTQTKAHLAGDEIMLSDTNMHICFILILCQNM